MITYRCFPLDMPTLKTGYVYPRREIERAIKEHNWLVALGDPATTSKIDLPLASVCGKVTKCYISDDNWLAIDVEWLDTPAGNKAKQIESELRAQPIAIGVVDDGVVRDYSISYFQLYEKEKEESA